MGPQLIHKYSVTLKYFTSDFKSLWKVEFTFLVTCNN